MHVAIIMDGNGRWARARGLPRIAGHREGARAVRRTVEACRQQGIRTLTLYAFSSDNWNRPPDEVRSLMRLFDTYLDRESSRCRKHGVRLSVIGRRDRFAPDLLDTIRRAEEATADCTTSHLRLAVDYSARWAIASAAQSLRSADEPCFETFTEALNREMHSIPAAPDVDLLIRTSGEKRLSDFLLWESAYAELVFTDRLWPDFGAEDLALAIREFEGRDRRFGRIREPDAIDRGDRRRSTA